MRFVLSVLLLALLPIVACTRSQSAGDAADAGRDAGAMDAPTRLGPCDDSALWSREVAASSVTPLRLQGCGPTNLARAGFGVSAPEACFRVTEAGPATGYVVGTTWRATAAGSALVAGFDFSVRVGAGPLELTARYVRDGELVETVATLEDTPRVPLFEGIRDFRGFGAGVRNPTVVTAYSVLSTDGNSVPLPGRALDARYHAFMGARTVVLLDTPTGRVLQVFGEGEDATGRQVALDVSRSARFVRGAAALFDSESREVIFLELTTLAEALRVTLSEGAELDFVVPHPDAELVYRTGERVWRSRPGEATEPLADVPGLRRLVPLASPSSSTALVLLGDDAFGFLGRLDGGPPALDFALPAPLDPAPFVATGAFWVSEAGFAWYQPVPAPDVGPMVDDMWAIHGGPLVDVAGRSFGAYVVAQPDDTFDVFPWSAGRCERE